MNSSQDVPLNMVGSSVFGRYPKISSEYTQNMIISDDFLVPYAGYQLRTEIGGLGRGLFVSQKLGKMIAVIDSTVYTIDSNLDYTRVNNIATFAGNVSIDEDIQKNIAICDGLNIYCYNWDKSKFTNAILNGFVPSYVCFQDGRFIATDALNSQWRLSDPVSASTGSLNFPNSSQYVGSFQTKPDSPIAVIRFPGRGNVLLIMGHNVCELWTDVGAQLFPYQKNTSYNIDYGCISPATIAANENIVIWLGGNERSGPAIMYTTGGDIQQISTDGINFKFAELNNPANSYGFLFKQDGHLLYQITFADPSDNFSLTYDFNTQKFFNLTNESGQAHIARKCVFFNGSYYFLGVDGNIYELSSDFSNFNYGENDDGIEVIWQIPRIRIPATFRLPDGSPFVTNSVTFPVEQGVNSGVSRIDLSISSNGGQFFGNSVGMELNSIGNYRNKFIYRGLGRANEMTTQFRFWSNGRFVVGNGTMSIYK